jgi:biotin operon repressor
MIKGWEPKPPTLNLSNQHKVCPSAGKRVYHHKPVATNKEYELSTKFGGPFLAFPRWVLPYLNGDNTAKAVLLELLVYMKPDTQTTTTSYKYIAEQVGVDRRTVIRAVTRLESAGVIIRRHRGTKGHNMSNAFVINFNNPEVVSPMTLGGDTGDTTSGDTHDTTPSVTHDTQIRVNNKSNKKSTHTKSRKTDYDDLEAGHV